MTTAYVLSGGANLGAAQVGMLAALAETGARPDLVIGASVGALNGAWVAADAPLEELADVWRSLRRSDVFPAQPMRGLLGFAGRSDHLVANSGLRRLLADHLRFENLQDAPIPFHVVATDLLTGAGVLLSRGAAAEAILASAAIPGVLPPVVIDGRAHIDGGVVNNTPISHVVELGAETVWVLATGYSCALEKPPRAALGLALHAANLVIHQRLSLDVERYADKRRPTGGSAAVPDRHRPHRLQPGRRPDPPLLRTHPSLAHRSDRIAVAGSCLAVRRPSPPPNLRRSRGEAMTGPSSVHRRMCQHADSPGRTHLFSTFPR